MQESLIVDFTIKYGRCAEIVEKLKKRLEGTGMSLVRVVGGGFIFLTPDTCIAFGQSVDYGHADCGTVKMLLRTILPHYEAIVVHDGFSAASHLNDSLKTVATHSNVLRCAATV